MKKMHQKIPSTHHGKAQSNLNDVPDASDSFLCSKCISYGYCIEMFYRKPNSNELIPIQNSEFNGLQKIHLAEPNPITDSEISNLVNVKTNIKEANTKFGKKLQQAHDLFHQDEFEQASYMYLDIIETRVDVTEAWRGICASFYFLGKYDEAVAACINTNSWIDNSFVNRFTTECDAKKEKKNVEIVDLNMVELSNLPKEKYARTYTTAVVI